MATIVSVVSGGVVQTQHFDVLNSGMPMPMPMPMRMRAVSGARYMLSENGASASDVSVKREGKNLFLEQRSDPSGRSTLVIDDFFTSGAQLLGLSAEGEYLPYLAVAEAGGEQLADTDDYALLTLAVVQQAALADGVQFAESVSRASSGGLAGLATLAGGFALSNGRDGSNSATAPAVALASLLPNADAVDAAAGAPAVFSVDAKGVAAWIEQGSSMAPEATVLADAISVQSADLAATGEDANQVMLAAGLAVDPVTKIKPATAGKSSALNADTLPVIDEVQDDMGAIQGNVESGDYTDDGRPQLVGKAAPGVQVHIYRNSELIGQVYAGADGQWSFMPKLPLADGRHVISILHEYPDGDFSDFSAPYVIFVDKSVPDAPLITGMLDDQGRIAGTISNLMVTDDSRPTIDGTAEAHSTIIVYDKGNEIGRTKVDANGNWHFTPEPALADGTHILSYSAVDRAGNGSERSASSEFVVDTRPEKINIYYADDDAGAVTGEVSNGGITDDTTPTLFGSATAGGIVSIYEGEVLLGQVTADVDGTWQFTPPAALSEGAHAFRATVTLVAKGESAPSKLFNLTVDLTAPALPSIDAIYDNEGAVQGLLLDGRSSDDRTPTLSGSAEAGSTVRIFDNGVLLGSVLADADGDWVYTPKLPLNDGVHGFTVTATDPAGNQTKQSAPYSMRIDSVLPDQPIIVNVKDDVDEVIMLQAGEITNDAKPTFIGTAQAGMTIKLYDGLTLLGQATADVGGNWEFTPATALSDGKHEVTATATNVAGQSSAATQAWKFEVDTTAPASPSIVSVYDNVGATQGNLASGKFTDDTLPLIGGKAEPHGVIIVKDNGVDIGRVTADASGNWTFQTLAPLSYGLHNLSAVAVDKAGNGSAPSSSFNFRVAQEGLTGLENFNTLNTFALSLPNFPLPSHIVLASGVTLTGDLAFHEPWFGEYPLGDGQVPMGDRLVALFVPDNGKIEMTLPFGTPTVSFFHTAQTSGHVVSFLDLDGVKLGQTVLVGGDGESYLKVSFAAPEGKLVGSIKIDAIDDYAAGFTIENLSWGVRYPTAIFIESAHVNGAGESVVTGKVMGVSELDANTVIQVSTDGGATWGNASFHLGAWTFVQGEAPTGTWSAQVRIVDQSSGLSYGLVDSKVADAARGASSSVPFNAFDSDGLPGLADVAEDAQPGPADRAEPTAGNRSWVDADMTHASGRVDAAGPTESAGESLAGLAPIDTLQASLLLLPAETELFALDAYLLDTVNLAAIVAPQWAPGAVGGLLDMHQVSYMAE